MPTWVTTPMPPDLVISDLLNEGKIRYLSGFFYSDIDLDYYNLGDVTLAKPLFIATKAYATLQAVKFKTRDLPLYIGPIQRYIKAD